MPFNENVIEDPSILSLFSEEAPVEQGMVEQEATEEVTDPSILSLFEEAPQEAPQAAPEGVVDPSLTDPTAMPEALPEAPVDAPVYEPTINSAWDGYTEKGAVDKTHPRWQGLSEEEIIEQVAADMGFKQNPENERAYMNKQAAIAAVKGIGEFAETEEERVILNAC